jgi:hypothetical protein
MKVVYPHGLIRGPFEKFVDWRQCAVIMQREAVTVVLKEPFHESGATRAV